MTESVFWFESIRFDPELLNQKKVRVQTKNLESILLYRKSGIFRYSMTNCFCALRFPDQQAQSILDGLQLEENPNLEDLKGKLQAYIKDKSVIRGDSNSLYCKV